MDQQPPIPPPQGQPLQAPPPVVVPQQSSGQATASLVLGICGLLVCPIICSALAIVFGVLARREIRERPGLGGWGQAQAGLILGIIGTALWVIAGIVIAIIAIAAENASEDYYYYLGALPLT